MSHSVSSSPQAGISFNHHGMVLVSLKPQSPGSSTWPQCIYYSTKYKTIKNILKLQTVEGQIGRIYLNVGHMFMFAKNIAQFSSQQIYIYWISRFFIFILDEIINIIQRYKHGHMKLQLSVNNLHSSQIHHKIRHISKYHSRRYLHGIRQMLKPSQVYKASMFIFLFGLVISHSP